MRFPPSSQNAQALPKAWLTVSKWLPPRNPDTDYWWQVTGKQLATLMDAAQYSAERQYEALLFHYHWFVPYLGKAPSLAGTFSVPCMLSTEGLPLEYSWKWNTRSTKPEVRYAIEPMSQFSRTEIDPLNHVATRELLYRLKTACPDVDATLVNHFWSTLYDHDRTKYMHEAAAGTPLATTGAVAVELSPKGIGFKSYIVPRRAGCSRELTPLAAWEDSLRELHPNSEARTALFDFIRAHSDERLLSPVMVAVDNVAPEQSRVKLYFKASRTSFSSVREILTLGGRVAIAESQFQSLRRLVNGLVGLAPDFPEEKEIPSTQVYNYGNMAEDKCPEIPALVSGYIFYFDIAPGRALPAAKFTVVTRGFRTDDLEIAGVITDWMESHGRGENCHDYVSMLKSLCPQGTLNGIRGLQAFVSCMLKEGEDMEVTTYLAPKVFSTSEARN